MKGYRKYTTASILALCVAGITASPSAARSLTTTIDPSHGPIQLTSCRAALLLVSARGSYTRIDVSFTNTAKRPVSAVRFVFQETDAFGEPLQTDTVDRVGTFAPGVAIDSSGWTGANVWTGWVLSTKLNAVECSVQLVRFDDGSEWRGTPVHHGLYFPPTPSPTATP